MDFSQVQVHGDVAARERTADTLADGGSFPLSGRPAPEPSGLMPSLLADALASTSRVAGGFRHVHFHVGGAAQAAAAALGAQAFTIGRDVVFGANCYRPGTPVGDRLIAHELVHVAQQASEDATRVDCKPDPAAKDSYRPLADTIAHVQQGWTWAIVSDKLSVLRKLEGLAKAVEAKDLVAIRTTVAEFIALDTASPLDPATAAMLLDVPMVLVSRVFLLGLTAESQILEQHFFRTRRLYYDQPSRGKGFPTRYAVLQRVVDEVVAAAKFDKPAVAEQAIDLALVAFKGLNDEAARLDLAEVRKEQDQARADAAHDAASAGSNYYQSAGSSADFYAALMGLVPPLIEVAQRAFQVLMDAAVGELEAGAGQAALAKAKTVLATKMAPVLGAFDVVMQIRKAQQPAVADPSFGLRRPLTVDVDVTRSDFDNQPRRHLDYFDRTKHAGSVKIEAYEQGDTSFAEKSLDVRRIFEIRKTQIAMLERLFGLAIDKTGKATAESKQNVAAMRAATGFKLHDNDSWRRFLLKKFRAAREESKDDWTALTATVGVLQGYLSAFTIHTPYNIDEFGDNYLTRTFPRALTGQLIHDCGVYALRVAYALSLVREELGLTFRAAVVPVHVGLIISFGDDVSKGALYVNNNKIDVFSGTTLKKFADHWRNSDSSGERLAQPVRLEAGKLHAEIAAAIFAERVDVPTRLVGVPATPSRSTPAAGKRALWDFYHQQVIKPPAVAPAKGTPQPELKYLDFLQAIKDMHNELRVPLYRQAHDLFRKHRDELTTAAADLTSHVPAKRANAQAVLARHREELVALFAPLRSRLAELEKKATEINDFMRSHPEAVGAGAQLRPAARLSLSADSLMYDYLEDSPDRGLLSGQITPEGWATEDALPRQAD